MMNKRGISGVVTAILLILLSIAAVIIVWSVVKPLIDRAGTEGQAECITISLDIVSATNISGTKQEVLVKRNPGAGDLTGITIRIVDDAEKADTIPCALTDGKLDELGTQTCPITGLPSGFGTWKTVEVYANVGSQKTLCTNFESTDVIKTA